MADRLININELCFILDYRPMAVRHAMARREWPLMPDKKINGRNRWNLLRVLEFAGISPSNYRPPTVDQLMKIAGIAPPEAA